MRVYQCQVNSIEVFLVKLIPFHDLQEEATIQNSFSVRLAKDYQGTVDRQCRVSQGATVSAASKGYITRI